MKEGKFYRCVNGGHFAEEGDFCELLVNDGSAAFKYQTRRGPKWVHNSCFDLTTPYDAPPKKENTMIEGKWYKCIESGSGVEAGRYYRCTRANSGRGSRGITSIWDGEEAAANSRFDPTPHDKTVFPNAPDLIERVRRIDPAAAEWLEFGDHSRQAFCTGTKDLSGVFVWGTSPQGDSYWRKINEALRGKEEKPVTETFKKGERVEVRDDEDEDWEEAVFLCMDEEAEGGLRYVVRNMFGSPDGYEFCRRPTSKRPHIEPGTPIEVWDDERRAEPKIERFRRWTSPDHAPYIVQTDRVNWKHCRVLAPTGVEV